MLHKSYRYRSAPVTSSVRILWVANQSNSNTVPRCTLPQPAANEPTEWTESLAYKSPMLLDTSRKRDLSTCAPNQLNLREISFHAQHPPTSRCRTNVDKQELVLGIFISFLSSVRTPSKRRRRNKLIWCRPSGASRPHPTLDQRVDPLCIA
ncbi:hypothetical protein BDR05DRAFT_969132 [Suillus weaverae]|nr:hypothetical protein BDR05DRAFT_969132 [Suillus weaverae]